MKIYAFCIDISMKYLLGLSISLNHYYKLIEINVQSIFIVRLNHLALEMVLDISIANCLSSSLLAPILRNSYGPRNMPKGTPPNMLEW